MRGVITSVVLGALTACAGPTPHAAVAAVRDAGPPRDAGVLVVREGSDPRAPGIGSSGGAASEPPQSDPTPTPADTHVRGCVPDGVYHVLSVVYPVGVISVMAGDTWTISEGGTHLTSTNAVAGHPSVRLSCDERTHRIVIPAPLASGAVTWSAGSDGPECFVFQSDGTPRTMIDLAGPY